MRIRNNTDLHREMYGLLKRVNRALISSSFHIQQRSCNAFKRAFSSMVLSEMIRCRWGLGAFLRDSSKSALTSASLTFSPLTAISHTSSLVNALITFNDCPCSLLTFQGTISRKSGSLYLRPLRSKASLSKQYSNSMTRNGRSLAEVTLKFSMHDWNSC